MLANATITAFLATTDAPRARKFYETPFTALGWRVTNVRTTMAALVKRDVTFERYDFLDQDDLGGWQAPSSARVAWFKDPDGNLLSLTEVGAP